MKKITQDEWIAKAKSVHGETYDYSLVEYVNTGTKVTIVCQIHGPFTQTPKAHTLLKQGCPLCAVIKRKATNLERYGSTTPIGNLYIKEKTQRTNLSRYGSISPFGDINVQTKSKETNIERYGHSCVLSSDIIKSKIKETNITRFGFENVFSSPQIQENIKKLYFDRYGVYNNKQSHMLDALPQLNDYGWLSDQYINQNKTAVQIGIELKLSDVTIGKYLNQCGIIIKYTTGYSVSCIRWLDSIMETEGIFIQHARNGGEFTIPTTKYRVDGYCEETNTVYEFHGDCFHGNPDVFEDDCCPNFYHPDKTAKELYDATIARENEIKSLGYNLVVMWENDFRQA